MLLALALLLAHGEIVWPPHSPNLPLFEGGSVFNLGRDDAALANASAHATSSALIVAMGERLGGRQGMWMTTGVYAGLKLVHETFLHNGSGPEVRTDLASSIGVAVTTAGIYELFHSLGWLQWSKPSG
ncbi:MAG: hypothetical protein ACJ79M_17100 [Myxococcales bacterium]